MLDMDSACPSCGTAFAGRFCAQCGERRLLSHDFSVRHHLEEALEIFTHLDSKILRSVWQLLRRPGGLSVDYLRGHRVRFMSPLRLFVFVSVVYFLSLTLLHELAFPAPPPIQFNTFATPLATQLQGNNFYPDFAARQVVRKLRGDGIAYAELERRYDEKTVVLSKTLVFVLIPVIALLLAGCLFRKRRTISEHLVIATHFWAFTLVLLGVVMPAVVVPVLYLSGWLGMSAAGIINDVSVSYVLQGVFALYLYVMLRRAYAASAWYSAVVALTLAWSFFFIVWLFRFLLFLVTLRAI